MREKKISILRLFSFVLLLAMASCGREPTAFVGKIVQTPTELRSVAPDGSLIRTLILADSRVVMSDRSDRSDSSGQIERISKDYVLSPGPGAPFVAVYSYRYSGPQGGGWNETRSHTFTFYDSNLKPIWSQSEVGGDPLGNDILFGDSGRVVLICNRAENLEAESSDAGMSGSMAASKPYIIVRDSSGRMLFEKRGSSFGFYAGGVALSPGGKFIAYGETPDGAITVVSLASSAVGKTLPPPAGSRWQDILLHVTDEGDIIAHIDREQGDAEWKGKPSW